MTESEAQEIRGNADAASEDWAGVVGYAPFGWRWLPAFFWRFRYHFCDKRMDADGWVAGMVLEIGWIGIWAPRCAVVAKRSDMTRALKSAAIDRAGRYVK